jgi:DNA processing protein
MDNLFLRFTYLIYIEKSVKYKIFDDLKNDNPDTIPEYIKSKLMSKNTSEFVKIEIEKSNKIGVKIIDYSSKEYPLSLKLIKNSPPVIYVEGNLDNTKKAIAIVGSRKATPYGLKVAYDLSYLLGSRNMIIVSGLAYGIDSKSHLGALESNGITYAVLGSGINIIYPKQNKILKDNITKNGAVISEFPLDTPPISFNFPVRNRVISGLSESIIIVEATLNSGAMITADFALEQGKDIYAVPGSIYSLQSEGTNNLIKNGAIIIDNINDFIYQFDSLFKPDIKKNIFNTILGEEESILLKLIDKEPLTINEIINNIDLPVNKIMSLLTQLEIKKLIESVDGCKYIRR